MNYRHTILIILAVCFTLFLSNTFFGAGLNFQEFYFEDNNIYLSLQSSVTDVLDIEGFINDGIELKVLYDISVYRVVTGFMLPDEMVTNIQVNFSAKKDFINDGYEIIQSSGFDEEHFWFKSCDDLYQKLMYLSDYQLVELDSLLSNERVSSEYYIEATVKFTSLELYPPLSIIYNLIGNWNYTSKAIQSRMFRIDGIIVD